MTKKYSNHVLWTCWLTAMLTIVALLVYAVLLPLHAVLCVLVTVTANMVSAFIRAVEASERWLLSYAIKK